MAKRVRKPTSQRPDTGQRPADGHPSVGANARQRRGGGPADRSSAGVPAGASPGRKAAGSGGPGGERPARKRPLYARALGLRALRPGPVLCFFFFEGTIAAAAVLALLGLVSWWGVLVLPLTVAVSVKLNDLIVAGAQRANAGDDAANRGRAADPRRELEDTALSLPPYPLSDPDDDQPIDRDDDPDDHHPDDDDPDSGDPDSRDPDSGDPDEVPRRGARPDTPNRPTQLIPTVGPRTGRPTRIPSRLPSARRSPGDRDVSAGSNRSGTAASANTDDATGSATGIGAYGGHGIGVPADDDDMTSSTTLLPALTETGAATEQSTGTSEPDSGSDAEAANGAPAVVPPTERPSGQPLPPRRPAETPEGEAAAEHPTGTDGDLDEHTEDGPDTHHPSVAGAPTAIIRQLPSRGEDHSSQPPLDETATLNEPVPADEAQPQPEALPLNTTASLDATAPLGTTVPLDETAAFNPIGDDEATDNQATNGAATQAPSYQPEEPPYRPKEPEAQPLQQTAPDERPEPSHGPAPEVARPARPAASTTDPGADELDGYLTTIRGSRPPLAEREEDLTAPPAQPRSPGQPMHPQRNTAGGLGHRKARARDIVRAARSAPRPDRRRK